MSSLAAARADNFYYPPEYRAEHGSLNKFRGSHPLGERAKRIHEGILVIRFEMPYKVFCNKCNEVIAKGVRFNAEKKTVGNYFSTKILEFTMKCCFCDNILKIQTDPKNCEYIPTLGIRRKVETFEASDVGTIEFRSAEERQEIEKDPMLKLETTFEDLSRAKQSHNQLEDLIDLQESRHSSDVQYELNSKVRKRFREWKKEEIEKEAERKKPRNFAIPLLPEHSIDREEASCIDYCTHASRLTRRIRQRVLETQGILQQPKKQIDVLHSDSQTTRETFPPRVIPSSAHKALSLVVSSAPQVLHSSTIPQGDSHQRRSRLHGDYERIKSCHRNARRASILEQRNRR